MRVPDDCGEPEHSSRAEEQHVFLPKQAIFREGEPGDTMYIIAAGEVEIVVNGQVLEVLKAGDIFGEMALLEDGLRSATAVARSACLLTPVTREHFLALIQHTPAFAIQVMRVLAQRLRRTTQHVVR